MKKLLLILLSLVVVVSMVACKNDKTPTPTEPDEMIIDASNNPEILLLDYNQFVINNAITDLKTAVSVFEQAGFSASDEPALNINTNMFTLSVTPMQKDGLTVYVTKNAQNTLDVFGVVGTSCENVTFFTGIRLGMTESDLYEYLGDWCEYAITNTDDATYWVLFGNDCALIVEMKDRVVTAVFSIDTTKCKIDIQLNDSKHSSDKEYKEKVSENDYSKWHSNQRATDVTCALSDVLIGGKKYDVNQLDMEEFYSTGFNEYVGIWNSIDGYVGRIFKNANGDRITIVNENDCSTIKAVILERSEQESTNECLQFGMRPGLPIEWFKSSLNDAGVFVRDNGIMIAKNDKNTIAIETASGEIERLILIVN